VRQKRAKDRVEGGREKRTLRKDREERKKGVGSLQESGWGKDDAFLQEEGGKRKKDRKKVKI